MKSLPLSRGYWATVDDDAPALLLLKKWSASVHAGGRVYAMRSEAGKRIYLHRLLMGSPKGFLIDHINGDCLDNRLCNLRAVTAAENQQNRNGPVRAKSGERNILSKGDGFIVRFVVNGKRHYGGYYTDLSEAIAARSRLAAELRCAA